jgi:pimeloyl-ACP methyl ester carboxylesterase
MRKYGRAPFDVVVVHGGPGAGGEMAPVARKLAHHRGVLEPIQRAVSLRGQIEELSRVINREAAQPVVLVGFSWGAWLSFLLAADHPESVKKLVLIASGPFDAKYAHGIGEARRRRLDDRQRTELIRLEQALGDPRADRQDTLLRRLGELVEIADAYARPLRRTRAADEMVFNSDIFRSVWPQAAALRESGRLLTRAADIRCPVVAIHGDHDPHPAEGVERPLSAVIDDFEFHCLQHCGHKPWIEPEAREAFFRLLVHAVL